MKNWIKLLIIIVIIGIITSLIIWKFYINKPQPDFKNKKVELTVNAQSLYNDFKSNKQSASLKYNGKVIEIEGKLNKIDKSANLLILVFVFDQGDYGDQGIRCTMLPGNSEKLNKLSLGSTIKVKGVCTGFNDTDVILEKATLIE